VGVGGCIYLYRLGRRAVGERAGVVDREVRAAVRVDGRKGWGRVGASSVNGEAHAGHGGPDLYISRTGWASDSVGEAARHPGRLF